MRWYDKHAGFVVAAVGIIGSLVTILAFVVPSSRDWMVDNGGWLWAVVILLATLFVWALLNWRRSEALRRAALLGDKPVLPADKRLWALFEQRLPQDNHCLQWLREAADQGTYRASDVLPLSKFTRDWRAERRRFQDPELEVGAAKLLAAIDAFRDLQVKHSELAPDAKQTDPNNQTYRIEEIVLREHTREAAALIDELGSLADAVLNADLELRQCAAHKGL